MSFAFPLVKVGYREDSLTCGGRDPQEAAEKAARARLSEVERLRRLHAGLDGREAAQVGLRPLGDTRACPLLRSQSAVSIITEYRPY